MKVTKNLCPLYFFLRLETDADFRPKSSVSCPPGHNGGSVSDHSFSGGVGGNVSGSTSLTEAATFNNTSLTVSINANTSPSNSQGKIKATHSILKPFQPIEQMLFIRNFFFKPKGFFYLIILLFSGSKDENRNHKRSKSRSTRPSVQEEVDSKERRKKSSSRSKEGASNGVAGFKLHEMYTNRAYESSENTPGTIITNSVSIVYVLMCTWINISVKI